MKKKIQMFIVSIFSVCLILTVSVPTITNAETVSSEIWTTATIMIDGESMEVPV